MRERHQLSFGLGLECEELPQSEPKRAGLWCFFSSSINAPADRKTGFHANQDKQED
jgi:hypothetical protein